MKPLAGNIDPRAVEDPIHLGRSWSDCDEFHFRGQPRVLRVWDETLLAGRPYSINERALFRLIPFLDDKRHYDLADHVKELAYRLPKMTDGALVRTWDIAEEFDLDLGTFLYSLAPNERDKIKDVAEALWSMSSNVVRVRHDGGSSRNSMLDFSEAFPDDMKPMLILDAGGRVRKTYEQQALHRQDIADLTYTPKTYARVTLNVMERGGGKDSFGRNYDGFVDRI